MNAFFLDGLTLAGVEQVEFRRRGDVGGFRLGFGEEKSATRFGLSKLAWNSSWESSLDDFDELFFRLLPPLLLGFGEANSLVPLVVLDDRLFPFDESEEVVRCTLRFDGAFEVDGRDLSFFFLDDGDCGEASQSPAENASLTVLCQSSSAAFDGGSGIQEVSSVGH